MHEENIGKRHVKYALHPNGTVEIHVKSSDTPFKIEIDEDVNIIFFFLGQVKTSLLSQGPKRTACATCNGVDSQIMCFK